MSGFEGEGHSAYEVLKTEVGELRHVVDVLTKDRDTYKDAYTETLIANTVANKRVLDLEQENAELRQHLADIRNGVRW